MSTDTRNTWPDGIRRALDQDVHEAWNAIHYPGTLQLCANCDEPTGRCEEDEMCGPDENHQDPLCEKCFAEAWETDR